MGKDLKGAELGECITQRKDGRYQARFTDRFSKRIEYKSTEIRDVRAWLTEQKARNQLNMNTCDQSTTLNEWYDRWMSIYKIDSIRESSKLVYKNIYEKQIRNTLGMRKMKDLSTLAVKGLLNDIKRSGYSFEIMNKTKILLSDMFNHALIDNLVQRNYAHGIKLERDEEHEPRVMTEEEQMLIVENMSGTFYGNMVNLILNTGLRIGEAAALTEKDIDFKTKTMRISKTLSYQQLESDKQKTFHFGPPKTRTSNRDVPLNEKAVLTLKRQILQKRAVEGFSPKPVSPELQDCLFTTRFNQPVCTQNLTEALDNAVNEINRMRVPLEQIERITPHALRHTFATRCIEAGMKPKILQTILGHATLQMTMDLYVHVCDDQRAKEIELLSKEMDALDERYTAIINNRYDKDAKILRIV